MKKTILLLALLIFGLFGFNPFGKIRANEPIKSAEEFEMHVNVVSDTDEDMEDVKVRMIIPELGIMAGSNSFDLDGGEKMGKFIFWDSDSVPKGDYLVRISVSNDKFRDVKHRYIVVI